MKSDILTDNRKRLWDGAEVRQLRQFLLAQPHMGFPRDFMYFTVVLETQEDGTFVTNTHSVFHTRQGLLSLEDYVNETVTVAWNRETGMVVVIK